jgi:zinc transport system ATP-binding protein
MNPALVSIRDLRVRLGGNEILKGVNAELQRGRITALIGLNGSGKTTLLRALVKEIPYAGQIQFLCGHKHTRPTPKHVGYVPQKLNVDARLPLTVRDLLALALQRRPLFLGISRRLNLELEDMLRKVGAKPALLDRPVEKISGGELQRVLLTLAMHPDPELLLLDEPAAGIDFRTEDEFYELIARINEERGVTILLVSHEMSMVSRRAHHVLCLEGGRIQCEGPPEQVMTEEVLGRTFGAGKVVYLHHHQHEHEHAVEPQRRASGA